MNSRWKETMFCSWNRFQHPQVEWLPVFPLPMTIKTKLSFPTIIFWRTDSSSNFFIWDKESTFWETNSFVPKSRGVFWIFSPPFPPQETRLKTRDNPRKEIWLNLLMICDCKLAEKNCDIFLQKIVKIFEEKNCWKVSIMPKKSLFLFF